jgi:hypothetical protein
MNLTFAVNYEQFRARTIVRERTQTMDVIDADGHIVEGGRCAGSDRAKFVEVQ